MLSLETRGCTKAVLVKGNLAGIRFIFVFYSVYSALSLIRYNNGNLGKNRLIYFYSLFSQFSV